jgi:hypothetical protein
MVIFPSFSQWTCDYIHFDPFCNSQDPAKRAQQLTELLEEVSRAKGIYAY